MSFSDIKIALDDFLLKHGLIERALNNCNEIIDHLIADGKKSNPDNLGGFSKDEIIPELDNQNLVINSWLYQMPIVEIQIGLYINNLSFLRNLEKIGYYELLVNADGEIIDDFFVIEKEKNEINLKYYFEEFNSCLPKNGLNPTSMHFNYVNLINRFLSFCQSKHYNLAIEAAILAYESSNNNEVLLKNNYYRKTRKGLKRILRILLDMNLIEYNHINSLMQIGLLKQNNTN